MRSLRRLTSALDQITADEAYGAYVGHLVSHGRPATGAHVRSTSSWLVRHQPRSGAVPQQTQQVQHAQRACASWRPGVAACQPRARKLLGSACHQHSVAGRRCALRGSGLRAAPASTRRCARPVPPILQPAVQLDNVAAAVLGIGYVLVAAIIFVTQSGGS